jgi:histone-lysine N-methyltransferase SETMAR
MMEFMRQGTTITSEVHCGTLKELLKAIQDKRCGMLTYGIVLPHDKARPHTSRGARTQAMLKHFDWELFDHPPYSPDLAQSDYHLLIYLKN